MDAEQNTLGADCRGRKWEEGITLLQTKILSYGTFLHTEILLEIHINLLILKFIRRRRPYHMTNNFIRSILQRFNYTTLVAL